MKSLRALAAIGFAVIALPSISLLLKVDWLSLITDLNRSGSAIWLSLWSSLLATFFAIILGVPLAWIFSQSQNSLVSFIRPIVLAPIVMPPTVAGLAMLAFLGRLGLLGKYIFQWSGWSMPFTSAAVVFAGLFVGLPFVTLICESTFRNLPKEVEDAAIIDRATATQLFRKIAIPQSRSGIVTGGILAWARVIGEFGATLMFAGSMPGRTQTWTMLIYQQLDVDVRSAYSLSAILLLIAIFVVFTLRKPLVEAFR